MDNDQIKHMVNRFLMWKLPEHFRPDCGIIYTPIRIADGRLLEPSGTNLLDATQAEAMVRHMIEGLPAARPASGEREGETPEDRAEQFIQAAVDRAPEPLRRLGEWLANVLDEDEWKTAERMLLGATTAPAPSPAPAGASDVSELVEMVKALAEGADEEDRKTIYEIATAISQQAAEIERLKAENVNLLSDVKSSKAHQWELVARDESAERERDEAKETLKFVGLHHLHNYQHSGVKHLVKPPPGAPICEWAAKELEAQQAALSASETRVKELEQRDIDGLFHAVARAEKAEARVRVLEEALKPFTKHYAPWMERQADGDRMTVYPVHTMGDLRRARTALAALTSALEAREWRTMESAPRDQRILLYAPGDPYSLPDLISVCEWHPDAGFCICELREPTHWRPLPPPPQGERE